MIFEIETDGSALNPGFSFETIPKPAVLNKTLSMPTCRQLLRLAGCTIEPLRQGAVSYYIYILKRLEH